MRLLNPFLGQGYFRIRPLHLPGASSRFLCCQPASKILFAMAGYIIRLRAPSKIGFCESKGEIPLTVLEGFWLTMV